VATGAPDWQKVVTIKTSVTAGAPDWERVVVGPGGTPVVTPTPNTWFKVESDSSTSPNLVTPWVPTWDPTKVTGAGAGMQLDTGDHTVVECLVPGIWEIVPVFAIAWTSAGGGTFSGEFAYNLVPTPVGANSDFLVNNSGIANSGYSVTFGAADSESGIVNTVPWTGYIAVGDHFFYELAIVWPSSGLVVSSYPAYLFCRLLNAVTY